MNTALSPSTLLDVVVDHLSRIYSKQELEPIARALLQAFSLSASAHQQASDPNKWSQQDVWLITYGDSVLDDQHHPLQSLLNFIDEHLQGSINGVHILPFFPYSSDDGFSVINYAQVNDSLGDWQDIRKIASKYRLMADLVINHCSTRSLWFDNFCQGKEPGAGFFIEMDPQTDLSAVVRPRTSPLLRPTQTLEGEKHVWCTFSHDQADLNFANPAVLIEMAKIVAGYLEQGVEVIRMDAIAFLWKELGTPCVHLPQTHEVVRLLRTLAEAHTPQSVLITETNVPNHENLSYFGNSNEAHAVYNFSLPPLLLHALLSGSCEHLKRWQMSMPPAQDGTFYFNFIASHDGIGLRPVSGLLGQQEIDKVINTVQSFGARISWRAVSGGLNEPYEINVALYDALQGTFAGPDRWQLDRFICAHAIMFALEGIPGIYIHSFLATQNDYAKMELTNHNRSINRHKWRSDQLEVKLSDPHSHHAQVLQRLKELLSIRQQQAAFHPNAVQFTLHLGDQIFGFWRQSRDRKQSIFCLHNVSDQPVSIPIGALNLIAGEEWCDLINGCELSAEQHDIELAPYGYAWISN